ncbi:unnamed protein product [Mytilus edulis]|uniref:Uncharacterized protein n=1 Tax=Mytilus edulis TaxID=6550 RepID=A0A8S3QF92_MYTED|nr:unnamed protein product [Mytilus edulis]
MPPTNALNVMTKMGLNTTNPKILQALKVMQGTKSKRGPKEKASFQRYIYCLPDKSLKLPRFSSSDETERAVVKQHQDQGPGQYTYFHTNKTACGVLKPVLNILQDDLTIDHQEPYTDMLVDQKSTCLNIQRWLVQKQRRCSQSNPNTPIRRDFFDLF